MLHHTENSELTPERQVAKGTAVDDGRQAAFELAEEVCLFSVCFTPTRRLNSSQQQQTRRVSLLKSAPRAIAQDKAVLVDYEMVRSRIRA